MTNFRRVAPVALILAATAALLYVGWSMLDRPTETTCSVCGREVHLAARVDGVDGDKPQTFCCAACALRAVAQGERSLQLIRVFDYESGEAIAPDEAIAVVGSSINLCMREHVLMDAQKEASELQFDRCSPSVLLFKTEAAAERFRIEHGGSVRPFRELMTAFPG